jgi:FkbM family methyltransferase
MQSIFEHHPVFRRFPTYSGPVDAGYVVDFLGIKTRCEFLAATASEAMNVQTGYPPLDNEYFEWIALLESVSTAKDRYTMMELGAGYGRWAVRAARAVMVYRQIPFHLVAVEAEPRHFKWLGHHMRDNEIDPREQRLLKAAVSDKPGEMLFYIARPEGGNNEAAEWYGQALTNSYEVVGKATQSSYEGHDVLELKGGWRTIRTACVLLKDIMPDVGRIDLIDMDLQAEELKVVASAIEVLDCRVVSLLINTHERAIEDGLRKLLTAHRWECKLDYKCLETNATPWGPISFLDGIQSWVNPRLA